MRQALLDQKATLIAYLTAKIAAEDWHACADAAMDLREIDAKLSVLPMDDSEEAAKWARRLG